MSEHREIKEACCTANLELRKLRLVDLVFGNVSVCDSRNRVFAIKPSGLAYDLLTPEAMVVLDYDGKVVEGDLRPSSDTPTHRCLYRHFPAARAVVHTHSRNAVAFAQAGRELSCMGTTHCDYFHGDIPVTRTMTKEEVGGDYEWETGKVIVECFQEARLDPATIPAVLVRNHGPFVWGESAAKAVENAHALEIVAEMTLKTLQLDAEAPNCPPYLLDKHYFRKHGAGAYYGQG